VVTDANGCIAGESCFEVIAPIGLDVDVQTTASTEAANGTITLAASGGTGTYTYNWADLDGTDNSRDRTGLAPGTFSVLITDGNGCTLPVDNIVIPGGADMCILPVIINSVVTDANCGLSNGSAMIALAGEISDYTITWSPDSGVSNGANSRTGLPAGTYMITVASNAAVDCSITETLVVGNVDAIAIIDPVITAASCLSPTGGADFSAMIGNLTYEWSDGGTGAIRTDLLAITHGVTITDEKTPDCPAVVSVTIPSQNDLVLSIEVLNQPNCGESNGTVRVVPSGGIGPFSYSFGDSDTQTNLPAGLNDVTVTDNATGCTQSITFTLTDNVSAATVSLSPTTATSCVGMNDGEIDFELTFEDGFASPETVQIQDANGIIFENGNLPPVMS